MQTWFKYLKQGLSSQLPQDRIAGDKSHTGLKESLKSLLPYLKHHRRKALLGGCLVLLASICGFPAPLITRYLVDEVILGRQLGLLVGAVILLAGFLLDEKLVAGLRIIIGAWVLRINLQDELSGFVELAHENS